nr:MAG TPA: hypothetical protein [Caudoviricetes sp.]
MMFGLNIRAKNYSLKIVLTKLLMFDIMRA